MALDSNFLADLEREDATADANVDALRAIDGIDFCSVWPTVKKILEYIRDHVLGGGIASRIVKWAIGQIIKIGDAACA